MPNTFTSIMEFYGTNSSSYTPTNQESGWTTAVPSQYLYVWFRVKTDDGSGMTVMSEPLIYSSPPPSDSGSPVVSTTPQYYGTNDESDVPDDLSIWSNTIPSGYTYVWTRVIIVYDDDSVYVTDPVLEVNEPDTGPEVDNVVVQYYGTNDEFYTPDENTEWSLSEPTGVAYIWSRSITTYKDGTSETSIPQRETVDDSDENPVASKTMQYYGTNDDTIIPDNSSEWSLTRPEGYSIIWFRIITQYKNGATAISDPQQEQRESPAPENPVVSVVSMYFGTNDPSVVPDENSEWSSAIPSNFSYIWVKTVATYQDWSTYTSKPILDPTLSDDIPVTPDDEPERESQEGDGDDEDIPEEAPSVDLGNQVVGSVNQYYGTNDANIVPDDTYTWSETAPQSYEYLWVRTVITYENGEVLKSTPTLDRSKGERAPSETKDPDVSYTSPQDPDEVEPIGDFNPVIVPSVPPEVVEFLISAEDFTLSQTQVFEALTGNGKLNGLYMGDVTYTDPDTGEEVTEKQLFVNADFIRSGTLQLGGSNNEFGIVQILDNSNKVISQWDRTGFTITSDESKDSNLDLFSIKRKNSDGSYTKYLSITDDGELVLLGSSVLVSTSSSARQTLVNALAEVDVALKQAHMDTDAAKRAAADAQGSADTANFAANQALTNAADAKASAENAQQEAFEAKNASLDAKDSANEALQNAASAATSANGALTQLGTVEDVIGTLAWISEHGTYGLTEDIEIKPGKTYYTRSQEGSSYVYAVVTAPESNPSEAGYYELKDVDESVSNYVSTHLALTNDGLFILMDNTGTDSDGYKLKLNNMGAYIIDRYGKEIATYGAETVIGNQNERNVQMDNSSVNIRNGSSVLASFGERTVIGPENGSHIEMNGSKMSFKANANTEVAYVAVDPGTNESVFYMNRAIVVQDLLFGDWQWKSRANHNLTLKWTGLGG